MQTNDVRSALRHVGANLGFFMPKGTALPPRAWKGTDTRTTRISNNWTADGADGQRTDDDDRTDGDGRTE